MEKLKNFFLNFFQTRRKEKIIIISIIVVLICLFAFSKGNNTETPEIIGGPKIDLDADSN